MKICDTDPQKNFTPMMKQYISIKAAHKEHILFYRLGDFYELFFDDAKLASNILNIVLTKRGGNSDNSVPMCGVPYHSASHYINKLIRKGFSIAICEQLESPEEAKKRGYHAIVKREVVQIITAGTLIDENILDSKNPNYLMCVAENKGRYAVSWVELTTGEFKVIKCNKLQITSEISRLNPAEILISACMLSDSTFITNAASDKIPITVRSNNIYDYKTCIKRIEQYYSIHSIKSFGNFSEEQVISCGVLIEYIVHTQKNNLPKLKIPKKLDKEFFVEIDLSTRINLEINKTPSNNNFNLFSVIDKTKTAAGGRFLKNRLNSPLKNSTIINQRLDSVTFFYKNKDIRCKIREYLNLFPDIQRHMSKIFVNRATPRDLNIIKNGLKVARTIHNLLYMNHFRSPKVVAIFTSYTPESYGRLIEELDLALIEIEDFNEGKEFVKKGYNQFLDELYDFKNSISQKVENLKNKYKNITGIQSLKISKNNILGYFIEVTSSNVHKIDQNIFSHKQSLGNTARFFTVELKELENSLLQSSSKIMNIEKEIFKNLCEKIQSYFNEIDLAVANIANIDYFSALAEFAAQHRCIRPQVDDSDAFLIEDGRHPVVEAFHHDNFIPNSTNITKDKRVWLITGPNMAGKSTFLRQSALICILAQIGSFVPSKMAHIGIVDKIFSRIGACDDIARGESTFMVEMRETAYIVNNATQKSLIILDEVGRGTSTNDGISIAWGVLRYIHNKINCRTLFATHYHELTQLNNQLPRVTHYTMKTKKWEEKIIFLYKIISGIADSSYGINVAEMAGMPEEIIDFAKFVLDNLKEREGINIDCSNFENRDYVENILMKTDINSLTSTEAQKVLHDIKERFKT